MMSSSLLLAFALATTLHPYEAVEPHMGTLIRIKLYAADEQQAQQAFRAAFDRVAQMDDELSDYKPDSELNRLARTAVGHPEQASDDLLREVVAAERYSQLTDGAFDITIGPLTHLWRAARKKHALPTAEEIAAAKAKCGFRKLHVDRAARTIWFDEAGMQLDVGGIAKGDAADQALAVLKQHGIASALVAASGDLAFSDAPPGEVGWKIGVDSFDSANARFTKVLMLQNAAVSTSGPEEQHFDVNGVRYSHIIDPQNGLGLTHNLTVTAEAPRGIDADTLALVVSVMGAKRGLPLIDSIPDAAALVYEENDGNARVLESKRFAALQTYAEASSKK